MYLLLADATKFNPTYLFLAITIGLLLGLLLTKRGKVDKTKIQGLDVKEFMDTKRKGTLVDIRNAKSYEVEKLVGAKNCPSASGARSGLIRKDIPIFIYDQNGKSAYRVAKSYVRSGAIMVYFMKGGYDAYKGEKK